MFGRFFSRIVKPRLFPAPVKTVEGTKWGYIDEKGKVVLKPAYANANGFQQNGLAIVSKREGTGIINQTGKFVVKPSYATILPFTEGRAIAMLNEGGSVVINEKGKVLTEKKYDYISPYQGGRAVYQETKNDTTRYGYLDLNGRVAIPARYLNVYDFNTGKGLVQVREDQYALLDSTGSQLQTFPYQQMNGLSEGLLSFKKTYQDKAGYVDETGKVIIPPQFGMALPFQGGRAVVNQSTDYQNEFGLIDKTGKYIISPKHNDMNILGGNRVSVGKALNPEEPFVGSMYALANAETGKLLSEFVYSEIGNYQGEYSSVTKGLQTFFVDKNGRQVKSLPIVDGIGTLTIEGQLVKAFVDQRLSYYDKTGKLVWSQNTEIPLTKTVSVMEEKYRPNKDYLVYYPQLQGMENKQAEKKVNEYLSVQSQVVPIPPNQQLDYNFTGDFDIQFFNKNLVILELSAYNYPFGAAHGMPTQMMVPIDIKSGQIYQLKDLFKKDSDYVKVLSEIVGKQIAENPEDYFPDAYKGIQPDQPFYVSSDSLFLYFTPYEIAPYAAGFPTFEIPFKEINSIIDKKGAFWRSFH
ncbi:Anti-sigma-V factor RsiV [Bacillus sp. THAF10]|uniref:WG repeat-containing protein n=1 Tax=Bacillus sp. THAF10 TaxID=2587848 RepID=UPI0012691FA7|nr:WG repeat-containing protein [Bacillus sp. THAF10]QFT89509.1 Anti-sigma-V factor RsiV [Bacillus sp. THAF10]